MKYLWHFRPSYADWSIVSSYFLTLLLQDSLPIFYANNEVYKLAWADVERVFISNTSYIYFLIFFYFIIIYLCAFLVGFHSDK